MAKTAKNTDAFCNLDRPLAFFDIESTGTSPRADRIVELAIMVLHTDGRRQSHTFLVNPGIPIPVEVTQIHGISDDDVKDCPAFNDVAPDVLAVLDPCDLAGYNILRFDVPMLVEEFRRANIAFDVDSRRLIDAQRIYHQHEPRDLTAALSFYCGEMHLDAHGAEADVLATIRVLEGQYQRYGDLPTDMDELHDYCSPRRPDWVDRQGKLRWLNREVVLNFGQKKGTPLRTLIEKDSGFIKWMLRSDFPADTRDIIQNAIDGTWPEPPELRTDNA